MGVGPQITLAPVHPLRFGTEYLKKPMKEGKSQEKLSLRRRAAIGHRGPKMFALAKS